MKNGDLIHVHPFGAPAQKTLARLLLVSGNQLSAAFAFEDKPPWFELMSGLFVHPKGAVILAIRRKDTDPWTDMLTGRPLVVTVAPTKDE